MADKERDFMPSSSSGEEVPNLQQQPDCAKSIDWAAVNKSHPMDDIRPD